MVCNSTTSKIQTLDKDSVYSRHKIARKEREKRGRKKQIDRDIERNYKVTCNIWKLFRSPFK